LTDLDEVLERFQMGAFEYGPGFSNHGPMAAEALVELGHSSLLTGLVDLYAPRLPPFEAGEAIAPEARTVARGDFSRTSDWVATYEADLAGADWRERLGCALAELAKGGFAAAAHGLLRAAHAARALERAVTPIRLRELAFGLGYWAGRYQELPGEPGSRGAGDAIEIFRNLEPVPVAQRKPGLFTESVKILDDYAPYVDAVETADLSDASSSDFIRALCEEGARLYLRNPQSRIAYGHAVTAPSALRLLLPYADEATRDVLARVAFQTALALHAVSSSPSTSEEPQIDDEVLRISQDPQEVRYRAACSLREHAIKLAECCLREQAIASSETLSLAAGDAAVNLENSGGSWG